MNFSKCEFEEKNTFWHILESNVAGKLGRTVVKLEVFLVPLSSQLSGNGWLVRGILSEF